MNYKQLKDEIRDLGFGENADIDELGTIIPNSINRAIQEINQTVSPIIDTYIIEQDGTEGSLIYYDIPELVAGEGKAFVDFADTPVLFSDDERTYKKFNDFEIERGSTIIIDGSVAGKFKIFYKKQHTQFSINAQSVEAFTGNGEKDTYETNHDIKTISSVTVKGAEITDYVFLKNTVVFTTPPSGEIVITYTINFDNVELELPLKAHILVPLLASYYIWLEDEKAKAVDYYNQYEKLSQSIQLDQEKPRMRILTGGI